MALAYWMVLAAGLMPYLFAGLAKSRGDFDNARPRVWLADVGGWRQRAHWAQLNSFEAFPLFAAGVVIAQLAGAAGAAVNALAVAFVLLRLIYGALYLADRAGWRSVVWVAALAVNVGLFVAGALA